MKRLTLSVLWMLLTLNSLPSLFAQENAWPRTVPLNQGTVTIYAPQVDDLTGDTIKFRSALAYRATEGAEPVFGAGWFESPVVIDSSRRLVQASELKVTETRFPAGTDSIQPELAMVLALQSPHWNIGFSLDEINTELKTDAVEKHAVNTAPPKIFYRDHPALLISIDGDPVLREIENSKLKAVVNTPYPMIYDGRHYYLNAAKDVWYQAPGATGPYRFDATPPAAIAAMVKPDEDTAAAEQPAEAVTASNAPEIVVSTVPAELIVTDGPAAFVPLVDDLLVLQNSDDDVFMDVDSQDYYIVLSGRWYRSRSLNGPWDYQPSDRLPTAFSNIPQDSSQADARVYVAGTEEAQEAVLDAQVPQTAAVERGVVDIDVKYDGDPVYQAVDGTDLVYIRNTGSTVLVAGGLYYLVQDGVWYVSGSPNGPWQVSDHRPAQVDRILPSSPVYNAKYVYVYDSTPDVVYVGYTPGYIGSYVYGDTIFYGTGWYYRPWVSPYYYYPRFSTWGFNVSYSPWYGWGFGLSWAWGPFSVAYYPGGYWHYNHYWYQPHYGYWGPGRYRPYYRHHGHDRYAYNDRHHNGHNRHDGRYDGRYGDWRYDNSRDRDGNYRPRSKDGGYNLYRNDTQRAKVASTRDRQMRTGNYYAGRDSGAKTVNRQVQTGTVKTRSRDYQAGPVSKTDLRTKTNVYAERNVKSRAVDSQARAANGKTRTQKYRAGPVSTTELRNKALDAKLEANNRIQPAGNGGDTYRKTGRNTERTKYAGGNADRTASPVTSRSRQTDSASNRARWNAPTSNGAAARQAQQKSAVSKQRAPVSTGTAYRQSAPVKTQSGQRQATQSAATTKVRQSRPVSGVPTTRSRVVQTNPAPRQAATPRSPQPKSVRMSTPRASAPAQSAPRQSARQSSKPASGTKSRSSGSGRSKGGHSRKD